MKQKGSQKKARVVSLKGFLCIEAGTEEFHEHFSLKSR